MTVRIKKHLSLLLVILVAGPATILGPVRPNGDITSTVSLSFRFNVATGESATVISGPSVRRRQSPRSAFSRSSGWGAGP